MYIGSLSLAWMNAFDQSTETVCQPSIMAMMRKNLTVDQLTTGAYDSSSSSMRSPLRQIRALNLVISPAGLRFSRKTQVVGIICSPFSIASDLRHSSQHSFAWSSVISLTAARRHAVRFLTSRIASSKVRVSGFLVLLER